MFGQAGLEKHKNV
jgi:hypothetical protein